MTTSREASPSFTHRVHRHTLTFAAAVLTLTGALLLVALVGLWFHLGPF